MWGLTVVFLSGNNVAPGSGERAALERDIGQSELGREARGSGASGGAGAGGSGGDAGECRDEESEGGGSHVWSGRG